MLDRIKECLGLHRKRIEKMQIDQDIHVNSHDLVEILVILLETVMTLDEVKAKLVTQAAAIADLKTRVDALTPQDLQVLGDLTDANTVAINAIAPAAIPPVTT